MPLESFFTGMAEIKDAPTMELPRFLVEFQPIGPGVAELVELCHLTYLQKKVGKTLITWDFHHILIWKTPLNFINANSLFS